MGLLQAMMNYNQAGGQPANENGITGLQRLGEALMMMSPRTAHIATNRQRMRQHSQDMDRQQTLKLAEYEDRKAKEEAWGGFVSNLYQNPDARIDDVFGMIQGLPAGLRDEAVNEVHRMNQHKQQMAKPVFDFLNRQGGTITEGDQNYSILKRGGYGGLLDLVSSSQSRNLPGLGLTDGSLSTMATVPKTWSFNSFEGNKLDRARKLAGVKKEGLLGLERALKAENLGRYDRRPQTSRLAKPLQPGKVLDNLANGFDLADVQGQNPTMAQAREKERRLERKLAGMSDESPLRGIFSRDLDKTKDWINRLTGPSGPVANAPQLQEPGMEPGGDEGTFRSYMRQFRERLGESLDSIGDGPDMAQAATEPPVSRGQSSARPSGYQFDMDQKRVKVDGVWYPAVEIDGSWMVTINGQRFKVKSPSGMPGAVK